MTSNPRRVRTAFKLVCVLLAALGVAVAVALYPTYIEWRQGVLLNRRAWNASFIERDLPIPTGGPRVGFRGEHVATRKHPQWGWQASPRSIPGRVEVDENGLQHAGARDAEQRVVLLGGSLAFGWFASAPETAFFARTAAWLERIGTPVHLVNAATYGWTTEQELAVLRHRPDELDADVVVVVNGLNDLTERRDEPFDERIHGYLVRINELVDVARARTAEVLLVLQPTPLEKRRTALEQEFVDLLFAPDAWNYPGVPEERFREGFATLRAGLHGIKWRPGVTFLDYSGFFDHEERTTFCDFWHVADPGHELLARDLAARLAPLLERRE